MREHRKGKGKNTRKERKTLSEDQRRSFASCSEECVTRGPGRSHHLVGTLHGPNSLLGCAAAITTEEGSGGGRRSAARHPGRRARFATFVCKVIRGK